ncbi:MAG: hypothetical protein ACXWZL_09670 [Mycobacterium sp.]
MAGAGVVPGLGRDGSQGGGDGLGAAVQDAQQLPVGPLAGGGGVAGVQAGGGLAEVAADVDVVDQDRDLQAAGCGVVGDGGDLLFVPVDEEHPLAHPLRVAAVGLVVRRADHRGDVVGDGGGHPFVAGEGAGMFLAAGRWGGDVGRFAGGGGEVGDRDDLGHLLDPRMRGVGLAGAAAVLGAQGDALAVGLHHQHVTGWAVLGVQGPPGVEVAGQGGQVRGQAGQLGPPDRHPGPGLDDLLGLPVPAGGQMEGHQGTHPQRVGVIRQHPPGVGRVQVRLTPVAVGQPLGPHRPEDAGHAPVVALLDAAVPDPRRTGDLADPLLTRTVDRERGLKQPPLQFPALGPEHLLPLPVIQARGLPGRPDQHRRELLRGAGQRRGQLTVHRVLAAVLVHLRHRHRNRNRHRRSSALCWVMGSHLCHDPPTGVTTAGPGNAVASRLSSLSLPPPPLTRADHPW